MARALYITHPEVVIDPGLPTPQWGLSEVGFARARTFTERWPLPQWTTIFASDERKALDLASVLAEATGAEILIDHALSENDRTSTGYLDKARFEAMADRFFADPQFGPAGWESAAAAQARIVVAVARLLATLPSGRLAVFAGHGAVGTLLKCHCARRPIARSEDQHRLGHSGGGNVFVFETDLTQLHADWTRLEDFHPEGLGLL